MNPLEEVRNQALKRKQEEEEAIKKRDLQKIQWGKDKLAQDRKIEDFVSQFEGLPVRCNPNSFSTLKLGCSSTAEGGNSWGESVIWVQYELTGFNQQGGYDYWIALRLVTQAASMVIENEYQIKVAGGISSVFVPWEAAQKKFIEYLSDVADPEATDQEIAMRKACLYGDETALHMLGDYLRERNRFEKCPVTFISELGSMEDGG